LSYETTHQHIQNTLPNADTMNIIVKGLPTKTNNIWRALVDLKKVFEALYWLKKNNNLYKDIKINQFLLAHTSELLVDEPVSICCETEFESDDIEKKSYLQNILRDLKVEPLAHYTVIDC